MRCGVSRLGNDKKAKGPFLVETKKILRKTYEFLECGLDRVRGMIIEVDEYKKKVPNYDPEQSELFHRESAKLADKDFEKHLKTGRYSEVIFMAGGAASGKTEFCVSYLMSDNVLVYDGTLKNFDGFKIKLSNIKRCAKNKPDSKVILIIPDNWKQAFEIFLSRERKMKIETFFDTHIRSKIAVARVLLETEINVEIFTSKPVENELKLSFSRNIIQNRNNAASELLQVARDLHYEAINRNFDLPINYDIFKKHEECK